MKKRKIKRKENKEKEMHVVTLWRLQYFSCALHTTLFYTVVQWFMRTVAFSYLSLRHSYLYLLRQSILEIIRKIQYRTILSILCRRLVDALLPNTILISKISSLLLPLLSYHNISLVQVFNDICTHLMYTSDRF